MVLELGQATSLPSTYKGDKMAFSDCYTAYCPFPSVLTSGHSREAESGDPGLGFPAGTSAPGLLQDHSCCADDGELAEPSNGFCSRIVRRGKGLDQMRS